MENFNGLSIACKHLNLECREPEINKLHKQKHATHAKCHRLRKKVDTMSVANKLLTICFIKLTHENEILKDNIIKHMAEIQEYIIE